MDRTKRVTWALGIVGLLVPLLALAAREPAFPDLAAHNYPVSVGSAARQAVSPASVLPAVGWAVGEAVDGYGTIIHTTDSGQTWVRQGSAGDIPAANLDSVAAIDAQNAWVTGASGVILRTTDGGETWHRQQIPAAVSGIELLGIYALDCSTAWAAGMQGLILHTTDGGETWTRQGQDTVPVVQLQGIYASDANHAWVVGDNEPGNKYGTIVRTTDGGASWEKVPYSAPDKGQNMLITIHGVDASTVWAVGPGHIVHTADGGATWVDQSPDQLGLAHANGVFAVDPNVIWVVADYGLIFRSDDAGDTWEVQPSGTNEYVLRISAVDSRAAWAVTATQGWPSGGQVLHTDDGGETWNMQAPPVTPRWSWVSFVRSRWGGYLYLPLVTKA